MNYELAKKLKDAGFKLKTKKYWAFQPTAGKFNLLEADEMYSGAFFKDDVFPAPDLEELIEACGENFLELSKEPDPLPDSKIKWVAISWESEDSLERINGLGSTPLEAVANLYLETNNKP